MKTFIVSLFVSFISLKTISAFVEEEDNQPGPAPVPAAAVSSNEFETIPGLENDVVESYILPYALGAASYYGPYVIDADSSGFKSNWRILASVSKGMRESCHRVLISPDIIVNGKTIHTWQNNFGLSDKLTKAVAVAVRAPIGLREINLCITDSLRTPSTPEAAALFAEHIKGLRTITILNIETSNPESLRCIARIIPTLLALKRVELDSRSSPISLSIAQDIARAIEGSKKLEEVNLSNNHIEDEGMCVILNSLQHSATLRDITLSNTNMGDASMPAFAEVLKKVSTLRCLTLSGNPIGPEGAKTLAQGIREGAFFYILNINRTHIGRTGAESLIRAVLDQKRFYTFDISENGVTRDRIPVDLMRQAEAVGLRIKFNKE